MTETHYLPPSSDIVFKMLFGDANNVDILRPFLRSVLPLPEDDIAELSLENPFSWKKPSEKVNVLDIKVKTASGRLIDVEIQVQNQKGFRERIVYYGAHLLTEQLGEGEPYKALKQAIVIVITGFRLLPDNPGYHNRYRLCNLETGEPFSDLLEIDTLELPKLPRTEDGKALWNWLRFLKAKDEEEMKMVAQLEQNADVKKAIVRLAQLSASEEARMIYEARLKAERDTFAQIETAREEGLAEGEARGKVRGKAEGLAEGEAKGRLAVARNLLGIGLSIDQIMRTTSLTRDEVQKLLH